MRNLVDDTLKLSGSMKQQEYAKGIIRQIRQKYPAIKLPLHVRDSVFWIAHKDSDIEQIIADSYKISGPFVQQFPKHTRDDAIDALMQLRDYVVIDIETNNIGKEAQAIQIAIVDNHRNVLFDKLIRPLYLDVVKHNKSTACKVNGITAEMIMDAPLLPEVLQDIVNIIYVRNAVAFNAQFDFRVLRNSALKHDIFLPPIHGICAMLLSTAYHESDFYLSLDEAIRYSGMRRTKRESAHSALGDCLVTVRLLNTLRKQAKLSLKRLEKRIE